MWVDARSVDEREVDLSEKVTVKVADLGNGECRLSAAVDGAILPGGGVALLKASWQLETTSPATSAGNAGARVSKDTKPRPTANVDQELGVTIIRRRIRTRLGRYTRIPGRTAVWSFRGFWGSMAERASSIGDIMRGGANPLKACVVEAPAEEGKKGGMVGMSGF
ncbi:hypothetical protein DFP72DRAFT_1055621 [Ephemerocybe angulata]|uniref:Uncharacterized protein n=1 Tax=Ephemerocybe angulata TaxID=980116 RepID=A0A8H6LU58_9AGAR|nr:hypothetical protein DFP72DRAFT_1055621 [Tulosesus angulatus]